MAAQITTYAGLKAGMLAWLARTGDALLMRASTTSC